MTARRPHRMMSINPLESLDERVVPAALAMVHPAVAVPPVISPAVATTPVTIPPVTVTAVTAKGGPVLGTIYQQYLNYASSGGAGTFTTPWSQEIAMSGTSVGVEIRVTGNLAVAVGELQASGMLVTATSAPFGIVEGYLPVSQLPTAAENAQVIGLSPIFRPIVR